MSPLRLLIADDHLVVRAGLQQLLLAEAGFEVIGEATNGREAVEMARRLHPDIVLMDLRMPEMDGTEATREIKQLFPQTQVLILTTYDSDADIVRAIEAGATGYVLKDAPRQELYAAIHAAAQGQSILAPAITTRLLNHLRAPAEEALSAREIEVLRLVARGASNKEIAVALWISEATVKTHLIHTFQKLGVQDRTAAVTLALNRGILRLEG